MGDVELERLQAWSYRQQGLDRPARSLLDALTDTVAVYSSNPTAPLSLVARSAESSLDAFTQLEQQRMAVRLPAMRGSVFLFPVATAPEVFGATRQSLEKLERRLDYGELTWADYERIKQAFRSIATSPMTSSELQDAIQVEGKLMVAIRLLAYEGLALRIGDGLRSDNFRYVSVLAWLDEPIEEREQDEALAWLADAYLRTFGPARVSDFAWWAGVTKGKAKTAMATVDTVDVGGGLLLPSGDLDAWHACQPLAGDEVAVLPKWDPYMMGYPADGRARFVRDEHQEMAYPRIRATRGDGAPLILRGGEAVASWGHRFKGERMTVEVTSFESTDRLDWLAEAHFEPAANVLGATELTVAIQQD